METQGIPSVLVPCLPPLLGCEKSPFSPWKRVRVCICMESRWVGCVLVVVGGLCGLQTEICGRSMMLAGVLNGCGAIL